MLLLMFTQTVSTSSAITCVEPGVQVAKQYIMRWRATTINQTTMSSSVASNADRGTNAGCCGALRLRLSLNAMSRRSVATSPSPCTSLAPSSAGRDCRKGAGKPCGRWICAHWADMSNNICLSSATRGIRAGLRELAHRLRAHPHLQHCCGGLLGSGRARGCFLELQNTLELGELLLHERHVSCKHGHVWLTDECQMQPRAALGSRMGPPSAQQITPTFSISSNSEPMYEIVSMIDGMMTLSRALTRCRTRQATGFDGYFRRGALVDAGAPNGLLHNAPCLLI